MADERAALDGAADGKEWQTARRAPSRVFVASDVELVCEGLAAQLSRHDGITVAGAGAPDEACCRRLAVDPVDAVIVDFGAVAASAFVARLRADRAGCRIVGIAIGKSRMSLAEWAAAGVSGFVDDDGTVADVARTVTVVTQGQFCSSPRTAHAVVQGLIARPSAPPPPALCAIAARLTPREREILEAIGRGASNKDIARTLNISAATVKNHVHHLLEKLEVSTRSQAAALLRAR
jgi:DNA-binding NarL/FixJ family response regulator